MKDDRLQRIDGNMFRVKNPFGVDAILFANAQVPIESVAITELVSLLELQRTAECIAGADHRCFSSSPKLCKVAVTPDFHKAAGVPVGTIMATRGFVVPAAIGNDVNCGMRLHITSLRAEQIIDRLDRLETRLRHSYFEGGRNIPMTRVQRESLVRDGLIGLLSTVPKSQVAGLWAAFHRHAERDIDRVEQFGSLPASRTLGLDDFLGPNELSRDSQIGSIGGGNHFVEIQQVNRILDGTTAHAWGLKTGMVSTDTKIYEVTGHEPLRGLRVLKLSSPPFLDWCVH